MIQPIGGSGVPRGEAARELHLPAKEHMLILHLPQGPAFDPQLLIGVFVVL